MRGCLRLVASETHPARKTKGRHGAGNDWEPASSPAGCRWLGCGNRAYQSSTSGRAGAGARPGCAYRDGLTNSLSSAAMRSLAVARRFFELVENEAVTGATRLYHRDLGPQIRRFQRAPAVGVAHTLDQVSGRIERLPHLGDDHGPHGKPTRPRWRFASRAGGMVAECLRGN